MVFSLLAFACSCALLTGALAEPYFEVCADPFLGRVVASRLSIHDAIEASLQNTTDGNSDARLEQTQEKLRPTYMALPKNERGRLGSSSVRYLLHRHFLHQRAWLLHGLAPSGGPWNASFPLDILQDWVPSDVRQVVANHLDGRGLSLRETAVLATMLENQVRADAIERLRLAWRALAIGKTASVDKMEDAVELHTMTYILPDLLEEMRSHNGPMPASSLIRVRATIPKGYPGWHRTQSFLREMLEEEAPSLQQELGFDVAQRVAVRAIEEHGRWQDEECHELKRDLVKLESSRPGRVDLRTFYREAVSGRHWQFSESMSYLRMLGALDESDPERPSVIIPNYIDSPSNYIASSKFYEVACIDECENLLGHIERRLAVPEARAEEVAKVVSALPSMFQTQRTLDHAHLHQLQAIAAVHGGRVPLHGRLFAQWMHHVYPRDCPYPHAAGTTKPMLPMEFNASTGLPPLETRAGMSKLIRSWAPREGLGTAPLMWDTHEEVLHVTAPAPAPANLHLILASPVAQAGASVTALAMIAMACGLACRTQIRAEGTARRLLSFPSSLEGREESSSPAVAQANVQV